MVDLMSLEPNTDDMQRNPPFSVLQAHIAFSVLQTHVATTFADHEALVLPARY